MADEIERKFLISHDGWKQHLRYPEGKKILQAYLILGEGQDLRITQGAHPYIVLSNATHTYRFAIEPKNGVSPQAEAHEMREALKFNRGQDGALVEDDEQHARIRILTAPDGSRKAKITIKRKVDGTNVSKKEFEYPMPLALAEQIVAEFQTNDIRKTRYDVNGPDGKQWEVDVFEGPHKGLQTAELELHAEDDTFQKPHWAGREVTGELSNYQMAKTGAIPKVLGLQLA